MLKMIADQYLELMVNPRMLVGDPVAHLRIIVYNSGAICDCKSLIIIGKIREFNRLAREGSYTGQSAYEHQDGR